MKSKKNNFIFFKENKSISVILRIFLSSFIVVAAFYVAPLFVNFAKENLVILDNLQRAYISIKNDPVLKTNKDLEKFLDNIKIIEKDLISIFKKNKIEKIDTKSKKFDPNFHQAMTEIEDDNFEPGAIVQEMLAGYMFGNRLLRPSLVAVSKKKAQNEVKKPEKEEKK